MQSKLATSSTEDKERKFDCLLRLIADTAWLAEAARISMASSGAKTPGIVGINKTILASNLQGELARIRAELLASSYQPLPARRVFIAMANGKLRPLEMPSLPGRIVHRAMLMAMEPIWESDFHRTPMVSGALEAFTMGYERSSWRYRTVTRNAAQDAG